MKYTEAAFRALEHDMIAFASEHHKNQVYSLDRPYTFHLRAVRDTVFRFLAYIPYGVPVEVVTLAAWGHDLIEDTGVTIEELTDRYGVEVSDLIWRVTNEPGVNRKARHEATYWKIKESPAAVFLKLADRIANVEAGGKTGMYRKEWLGFKAALYTEGELDPMWDHLENLLTSNEE
jgi:(p)ppGpp synthase/HD superfamily hydrolase